MTLFVSTHKRVSVKVQEVAGKMNLDLDGNDVFLWLACELKHWFITWKQGHLIFFQAL